MYSENQRLYKCSIQSKILSYEHKGRSNCKFTGYNNEIDSTRGFQVTQNGSFQFLSWKN